MTELPHTKSCFVCGESNPIGLNLRFETDGRVVQARFTPRSEHVGFSKIVHGGLIATLLDEVMVWACAVGTKRFAFCAEFAVRFQKPLRPDEEVQVVGELVADRKRIFEAKAELRTAGGAVVASATGKYMPIKEKDTRQMAADFVQGSANLFFGTSPSA